MNSKVRENFLERSGKSQGILKSWSAGHPVLWHCLWLMVWVSLEPITMRLLYVHWCSTHSSSCRCFWIRLSSVAWKIPSVKVAFLAIGILCFWLVVLTHPCSLSLVLTIHLSRAFSILFNPYLIMFLTIKW